MHPIKKAIEEVKYRIPRDLLQRVFIDSSRLGRNNWRANLDEQILALVIKPRVLVDCNMLGGTQQLIPLAGLAMETPPDYQWATVVHIPKERTQGKTINSVLHVVFFNSAQVAGYVGANLMGGGVIGAGFNPMSSDNSALTASMAGVLSAMDKIPQTSTANVQLIGENTILIRDGAIIPQYSFLRCVLADDEELSSLQLRSYRHFANLVEFAVKSYLYNELIIQIDAGELRYGQTLGVFKSILESYSDAEANYRDYLTNVWEKVAMMNDDTTFTRFQKLLIGGYR